MEVATRSPLICSLSGSVTQTVTHSHDFPSHEPSGGELGATDDEQNKVHGSYSSAAAVRCRGAPRPRLRVCRRSHAALAALSHRTVQSVSRRETMEGAFFKEGNEPTALPCSQRRRIQTLSPVNFSPSTFPSRSGLYLLSFLTEARRAAARAAARLLGVCLWEKLFFSCIRFFSLFSAPFLPLSAGRVHSVAVGVKTSFVCVCFPFTCRQRAG